MEYLVKWEGFADDEATWEPKRNILCKVCVGGRCMGVCVGFVCVCGCIQTLDTWEPKRKNLCKVCV